MFSATHAALFYTHSAHLPFVASDAADYAPVLASGFISPFAPFPVCIALRSSNLAAIPSYIEFLAVASFA